MDRYLIWIAAAGLVVTVLGGIAATAIVIKLPQDYFVRPESADRGSGSLGRAARNIAGVLLIAGGILLMLPGVPGPGVVVLLLGLSLTDLPGKRRLIRSVVRKPFVLRSLNRVRRRFGQPDLVIP